MKIVVTGAAGYLGSRIADALLRSDSPLPVTELLLIDVITPPSRPDSRVRTEAIDLTSPTAAGRLITLDTDVFFHLAAIVSGHAESDFDHGMNVNFDVTRALLEQTRKVTPNLKFIFTSSVAVYGGNLPNILTDLTATQPETSYGTQKALCELLINDYSRKKFVDGRFVRLPTITVRAGAANRAMTSFVSGIVREPLNGEEAICPVAEDQKIWISSPRTIVHNIIHAATLPASSLGTWRGINLPGFAVSVNDILDALKKVAGEKVAGLVRVKRDAEICRMLASLPIQFDNSYALNLGFQVDTNFVDVIQIYVQDDLKKNI